jgi:hypothetical protein
MACASLRACAAGTLADAPEQNETEEPSGDDTVQRREEEGAAETGSGGCEWMRLRVDLRHEFRGGRRRIGVKQEGVDENKGRLSTAMRGRGGGGTFAS